MREAALKTYAHYIWDFDGTLFDSYPHSAAALHATALYFGIAADPVEIERALHISFATAYHMLNLSEAQLQYFHALRARRDFPPAVVPFSDARDTLEALMARGARHYLFTHSNRRMSVAYLHEFGMDGLFADFVTADMGFPHKPAPDGILHLLKRHGIRPDAAVMVGDREIDVLSGRNAGIDGILVSGTVPADTCARYVVRRLAEIAGHGMEW